MSSTVQHILDGKGKDVWSVTPENSVYDALRMMADKGVGALLVIEGDKLVGIFSERDYARKIILQGKSSKESKVKEIMTSKVITVHPQQTVHECMELMTNQRVRHLPVVVDDKVLGVISIGDVVRTVIFEQRQKIKDLESKLISKQSEA
jgi:CBS domain-containing protein